MTREQLRTALLAASDKVRNSLLWRFMSPQERNLSIGGRQFWAANNAVTNAALDAFAANLATLQTQPDKREASHTEEFLKALWDSILTRKDN